jgi:hypothetical protein
MWGLCVRESERVRIRRRRRMTDAIAHRLRTRRAEKDNTTYAPKEKEERKQVS